MAMFDAKTRERVMREALAHWKPSLRETRKAKDENGKEITVYVHPMPKPADRPQSLHQAGKLALAALDLRSVTKAAARSAEYKDPGDHFAGVVATLAESAELADAAYSALVKADRHTGAEIPKASKPRERVKEIPGIGVVDESQDLFRINAAGRETRKIPEFLAMGVLTSEALDRCKVEIGVGGKTVMVTPDGAPFKLTWDKDDAAAQLERVTA